MKKIIAVSMILCTVLTLIIVTGVPCYSDVINACKQKTNGQLRIVDRPNACHRNEVPLSWNQTGMQGPQGLPGTNILDALYDKICDFADGCSCNNNQDVVLNYGVECSNPEAVAGSYVMHGYPNGVVAVCTTRIYTDQTPVRIHLWCIQR